MLPDDGDDLRSAGARFTSVLLPVCVSSDGGDGLRTSSSIKARRRPEPAERRKLCSMNKGLNPVLLSPCAIQYR